ncbi:hypothetical protein ACIPRL_08115 [Streptomyces sp. NPDC090085]|uniref:hypothetical protein n=1 Tax=Streptomyces sp. NPDC090085 TaxID=3365943 RepID=UPI00381CCFED
MYRYRCERCGTTSPSVRSRDLAHTERARHRDAAHSGHIPDGEKITYDGDQISSTDTRRVVILIAVVLAAIWLYDKLT